MKLYLFLYLLIIVQCVLSTVALEDSTTPTAASGATTTTTTASNVQTQIYIVSGVLGGCMVLLLVFQVILAVFLVRYTTLIKVDIINLVRP